jgi:protein O-mannosyl-transferase
MNETASGSSKAVLRAADFAMQGDRIRPNLPQIMLTVVLASTFVAYIATLWYPFVLDDVLQIVQNPFINSWTQVPGYFSSYIWNKGWATAGGAASFYRPVFFIWLLLNRTLFGLHAWGWHLTAILAHLGATFLVYRLALKLSKDRWIPLIAALIFGLHPVHVEAVVWISGATEPVLSLLFLGSLLALINYRERTDARFFALSLGLFLLALFSKETALALPGVVIAYEFIFNERTSDPDTSDWVSRSRTRCKIVFPFLAVTVSYVVVRRLVFRSFPAAVSKIPFKTMALTWPSVLEFYIKHLVWPTNLSVFYDSAFVTKATFLHFWLPLSMVVVTAAILVSVAIYSRTAILTFGLIWMLVTILPSLNFRVFQWREIAHDRYLYLPSVGFAMLLAVAIRRIPAASAQLITAPALQGVCVSLLGIVLGVSTVGQSMVWASPLTLYCHAASVAPNNAGALYLLAGEFVARGQIKDGAAIYERLLLIAPNWGQAWLQLGTLSFRAGQNGQAETQLLRATELDKSNAAAFYLLGLSYDESHKLREAEAALRRAVALEPSGSGFHLALGSVLEEIGNPQAATVEFQKELQYHPETHLPRNKHIN